MGLVRRAAYRQNHPVPTHFRFAEDRPEVHAMLKWAIVLAVMAAVAGWLGFSGVVACDAGTAKILLVAFLFGCLLLTLLAALGVSAQRR